MILSLNTPLFWLCGILLVFLAGLVSFIWWMNRKDAQERKRINNKLGDGGE
jgi:preprotein translocase subunit YajC